MSVKAKQIAVTIGAGAVLWYGYGLVKRAGCPALGDAEKAKLIGYVQKKYRMPAGAPLEVSEESRVGSTCYRRLLFKSQDPGKRFRLELFLSPDQRFLARDLLDSSVDPVAEDRKATGKLLAGVAQGNFPALGKPDAPVTIAVFSDFECPYCARFADTVKQVVPADNRVRLVFRHFPLPMHPWARPAAEAAACAQDQGVAFFWDVHNFLFEHQRELSSENLRQELAEYSKSLPGFDGKKFVSCLDGKAAAARVDQDLAFGNENGIHGTPTVFINGRQSQASSAEQLRALVADAIKNPGAAPQTAGGPGAPDQPQAGGRILAGVAQGSFPALGKESAPVTIAVFSDFQCPYCARFAGVLKDVLPKEGDRVRLVFRHLPLSMHSWARPAAEAAACAQDQGITYFWSFHDFFFEHQKEFSSVNLRQKLAEHSKGLSAFDQRRFAACLDR